MESAPSNSTEKRTRKPRRKAEPLSHWCALNAHLAATKPGPAELLELMQQEVMREKTRWAILDRLIAKWKKAVERDLRAKLRAAIDGGE